MGEKELVFKLLEFNRIGYECVKCKTVVVFDVTSTDTQVPEGCPCCSATPLGATVRRCLNLYRNMYQEVLNSAEGFTLQFRITPPGEKDS